MNEPETPGAAPAGGADVNEDALVEGEMRRRTRRSFLVAGVAAGIGYAGWRWLKTRPDVDGIPSPLRKILGLNEKISRRLFDPNHRIPELAISSATANGPRVNGDIGLDAPVDLNSWRLRVAGTNLALSLADLRTLPEISQVTSLNCIEGWTTVARWTGVRFLDFTEKFFPQGRRKPYVGLSTPTRDYYVGLDAPSAFHGQTLLCYAINGQPLSTAHGAPLRLLIPTKYGIKNLKRVGEVRFADERPSDYWAEQGYDWYAGL